MIHIYLFRWRGAEALTPSKSPQRRAVLFRGSNVTTAVSGASSRFALCKQSERGWSRAIRSGGTFANACLGPSSRFSMGELSVKSLWCDLEQNIFSHVTPRCLCCSKIVPPPTCCCALTHDFFFFVFFPHGNYQSCGDSVWVTPTPPHPPVLSPWPDRVACITLWGDME